MTDKRADGQTSKEFVIGEVTDTDAVWPELEGLVLGIIEYHRPWDQRVLRADWATRMREYMASHCFTLVARSESGAPLGFLSGTVGPDVGIFEGVVGHIDNAFVIESARRQGVGRALAERFEKRCRDEGARSIRLDVAAGNSMGFVFWAQASFVTSRFELEKRLEEPR